jgi:uncharacterized protein (DUF58 family)
MISKVFRRLQDFISIKTKRIFIIPSRYGIYFLLTLFILFLISLSFGHSLAFTTTFIFFSLIMVSAHFTNYNIDRVHVASLKAINVVACEESSFDVLVINESNKWRFDMQLSFVHSGRSEVFSLKPHERKIVRVSAVIAERGSYRVERMRLFTTFPFGLFYAWSFKELNSNFICEPKRSQEELTLPSGQSYSSESGDSKELTMGGSEDFYGHINYQDGMPPKGIDWKALARGRGKLYKQFVEYGGSRLLLDFNHVTGTLEEKVEKLALLLDLAESNGHTYAFSSEDKEPLFGKGLEFKKQCLEELALFKSTKRVMS